MKTTDFAMLVNQFIMEYLVAARDLSPNTVLSYRDSIVLLITWKKTRSPGDCRYNRGTRGRVPWLAGIRKDKQPFDEKYKACSNPLPVQVPLQPAAGTYISFPADTVHTCKENSTDRSNISGHGSDGKTACGARRHNSKRKKGSGTAMPSL